MRTYGLRETEQPHSVVWSGHSSELQHCRPTPATSDLQQLPKPFLPSTHPLSGLLTLDRPSHDIDVDAIFHLHQIKAELILASAAQHFFIIVNLLADRADALAARLLHSLNLVL